MVYRCCHPTTLRFNVLCIQRSSSVYKDYYLNYSCLSSILAILTLYLSLIRDYFLVLPLDEISFRFWLFSAICFFMVILVARLFLKESSTPLTLLTMAYSMSFKLLQFPMLTYEPKFRMLYEQCVNGCKQLIASTLLFGEKHP